MSCMLRKKQFPPRLEINGIRENQSSVVMDTAPLNQIPNFLPGLLTDPIIDPRHSLVW